MKEGCELLLFSRKIGNPMNTAGYAVPTLLPERKVTTNSLQIMFQQSLHTLAVSPLKRKAQVNLKRYERRNKKSKRTCLMDETTRETVTAADNEANLDSGSKEVYTQTDEVVTMHLSTMTDVSMEYVEPLEKKCMKSTNSRLESYVKTRNEWSKELFMSDESG